MMKLLGSAARAWAMPLMNPSGAAVRRTVLWVPPIAGQSEVVGPHSNGYAGSMVERLEIGRRYHCRELAPGSTRTGVFWRDREQIEAKLFDYDGFFHLQDGAPLHLRLEDNVVVSLLDTVSSGPGHASSLVEPCATTWFSGVVANTLIIGRRPWSPSDPIRTVRFRVPHSKRLLGNKAILAGLRSRRFPPKSASAPLFRVEVTGLKVTCRCAFSGTWEFGIGDWEPVFEIGFEEARDLRSYLAPVHAVLQFLSAAAGFHLTPGSIVVSPLASVEADAAGAPRRAEEFGVEYVWTEGVVETSDLHVRNSFVDAFDKAGQFSLEACLREWLARDPAWTKATTLMMGSLNLVKEASGHRLLMASRWLEAIPGARAKPALSSNEIDQIAAAASACAERLGHASIAARMSGLLNTLRLESNQARFERLVASVTSVFGESALGTGADGNGIVPALKRGLRFRGQEAHSFVAEDGGEVLPLMEATAALEALCYLLTIRDLPIGDDGRSRALHNRVVRRYDFARLAVAAALQEDPAAQPPSERSSR